MKQYCNISGSDSWEMEDNKFYCPSLLPWKNFLASVQGGVTQKEIGTLPGWRRNRAENPERPRWHKGQRKKYQWEGNFTESEPQRTMEGSPLVSWQGLTGVWMWGDSQGPGKQKHLRIRGTDTRCSARTRSSACSYQPGWKTSRCIV